MILSRWPVVAHRTEVYKHRTVAERFLANKGFQEVVIRHPSLGRVTIFNLHTASAALNPDGPGMEILRQLEIDQTMHSVHKARRRGESVIVLGDFNAGPEASLSNYATLIKSGWRDCFLEAHTDFAGRPDDELLLAQLADEEVPLDVRRKRKTMKNLLLLLASTSARRGPPKIGFLAKIRKNFRFESANNDNRHTASIGSSQPVSNLDDSESSVFSSESEFEDLDVDSAGEKFSDGIHTESDSNTIPGASSKKSSRPQNEQQHNKSQKDMTARRRKREGGQNKKRRKRDFIKAMFTATSSSVVPVADTGSFNHQTQTATASTTTTTNQPLHPSTSCHPNRSTPQADLDDDYLQLDSPHAHKKGIPSYTAHHQQQHQQLHTSASKFGNIHAHDESIKRVGSTELVPHHAASGLLSHPPSNHPPTLNKVIPGVITFNYDQQNLRASSSGDETRSRLLPNPPADIFGANSLHHAPVSASLDSSSTPVVNVLQRQGTASLNPVATIFTHLTSTSNSTIPLPPPQPWTSGNQPSTSIIRQSTLSQGNKMSVELSGSHTGTSANLSSSTCYVPTNKRPPPISTQVAGGGEQSVVSPSSQEHSANLTHISSNSQNFFSFSGKPTDSRTVANSHSSALANSTAVPHSATLKAPVSPLPISSFHHHAGSSGGGGSSSKVSKSLLKEVKLHVDSETNRRRALEERLLTSGTIASNVSLSTISPQNKATILAHHHHPSMIGKASSIGILGRIPNSQLSSPNDGPLPSVPLNSAGVLLGFSIDSNSHPVCLEDLSDKKLRAGVNGAEVSNMSTATSTAMLAHNKPEMNLDITVQSTSNFGSPQNGVFGSLTSPLKENNRFPSDNNNQGIVNFSSRMDSSCSFDNSLHALDDTPISKIHLESTEHDDKGKSSSLTKPHASLPMSVSKFPFRLSTAVDPQSDLENNHTSPSPERCFKGVSFKVRQTSDMQELNTNNLHDSKQEQASLTSRMSDTDFLFSSVAPPSRHQFLSDRNTDSELNFSSPLNRLDLNGNKKDNGYGSNDSIDPQVKINNRSNQNSIVLTAPISTSSNLHQHQQPSLSSDRLYGTSTTPATYADPLPSTQVINGLRLVNPPVMLNNSIQEFSSQDASPRVREAHAVPVSTANPQSFAAHDDVSRTVVDTSNKIDVNVQEDFMDAVDTLLSHLPHRFTWCPKNPLNAVGIHANCAGQRCDHVFLPPKSIDSKFASWTPTIASICFTEACVDISNSNGGNGDNNITAKNEYLSPQSSDPSVLVTISDHYGVYIRLEKMSKHEQILSMSHVNYARQQSRYDKEKSQQMESKDADFEDLLDFLVERDRLSRKDQEALMENEFKKYFQISEKTLNFLQRERKKGKPICCCCYPSFGNGEAEDPVDPTMMINASRLLIQKQELTMSDGIKLPWWKRVFGCSKKNIKEVSLANKTSFEPQQHVESNIELAISSSHQNCEETRHGHRGFTTTAASRNVAFSPSPLNNNSTNFSVLTGKDENNNNVSPILKSQKSPPRRHSVHPSHNRTPSDFALLPPLASKQFSTLSDSSDRSFSTEKKSGILKNKYDSVSRMSLQHQASLQPSSVDVILSATTPFSPQSRLNQMKNAYISSSYLPAQAKSINASQEAMYATTKNGNLKTNSSRNVEINLEGDKEYYKEEIGVVRPKTRRLSKTTLEFDPNSNLNYL